jgi:nitroreductase
VPIHELLAVRWSPRAFDASRPVTREQITALIEAARWAPSCFGDEPWRFLVWDRATEEAGWQRAFDCLSPGNQSWVKNVPLLLAAVASPAFDHNGKPNRWAQYDTGAASENLVLQAVALGLSAHQMGGFDIDKLRTEFGIPDGFTPMAMIAVGYQAAPDLLAEEQRAKELAPRARKPHEARFFAGKWGVPVG